jgi:hypothetical protein
MNAFAASDLKAADPLARPGDDGAPCTGSPAASPRRRRGTGHDRWSAWRRRHQHTAQGCHYQRQAAHDP